MNTEEKKYPKFRRGILGYSLVLRVLMDRPQTTKELETTLGIGNSPLRLLMSQMRSRKLIHVNAWIPNDVGRSWFMQWAVGDKPDASLPLNRFGEPAKIRRNAKQHARPELAAFVVMLEELQNAVTISALSEMMGVYRDTVSRQLKFMQSLRLVHIAGWDRSSGSYKPVAMYKWGDFPNLPRPKAKGKKHYDAVAWQKRKQRNADVRMMKAMAGLLTARGPNSGSFKKKASSLQAQ